MKNIIYILASVFILSACNNADDLMTADAQEGAVLNISGSSGSLAGAPEAGMELDEAEIDFQLAELNYNIAFVGNSGMNVSKLVVTKTYGGQTVQVAEAAGGVDGTINVSYSTIADFLDGFTGVAITDFRIGDVVAFETTIVMDDGRELSYPAGNLNIGISCLADLTGTYSVTNSGCDNANFPFEVEITKNADGTWALSSADGGFLHRCTGNSTLVNAGNITEQCGVILFSGDLDFGSAGGTYDIGDISGGTWDAVTGTLTMDHSQTFTGNWASEWTSTYVRQ